MPCGISEMPPGQALPLAGGQSWGHLARALPAEPRPQHGRHVPPPRRFQKEQRLLPGFLDGTPWLFGEWAQI